VKDLAVKDGMYGVAHPAAEDDRLAERKHVVDLRSDVSVVAEQATELCGYLSFERWIDQAVLSCEG
jgi:hypothetical protein